MTARRLAAAALFVVLVGLTGLGFLSLWELVEALVEARERLGTGHPRVAALEAGAWLAGIVWTIAVAALAVLAWGAVRGKSIRQDEASRQQEMICTHCGQPTGVSPYTHLKQCPVCGVGYPDLVTRAEHEISLRSRGWGRRVGP